MGEYSISWTCSTSDSTWTSCDFYYINPYTGRFESLWEQQQREVLRENRKIQKQITLCLPNPTIF